MTNHFTRAPLDVTQLSGELGQAWRIRYFRSIGSTNEYLRSLADGERVPWTIAVTDYQAAGRGRRGRSWSAPPLSSVLLSAVLPLEGVSAGQTVMAVALAARAAISDVTGLPAELKWPNDVLVRSRKVCGILVETAGQHAIAGIGINCNFDRDEEPGLPETATTLYAELGTQVSRERLTIALCKHLKLCYGCLTRDSGAVFAAWKSSLVTLGRHVLVEDARSSWVGVAIDVQPDGALLVRDESGVERPVYAATVSLRDHGASSRS